MGAFSRDFTTNFPGSAGLLAGFLKIEKLKAPLFRGPIEAGDTNDWCITDLKFAVLDGSLIEVLKFRTKNRSPPTMNSQTEIVQRMHFKVRKS